MSTAESAAPGAAPGAVVFPAGGPRPVVGAARRRFGVLVALATVFLIFAGAEVKSRQAGLAVPDWPLAHGMFFPPMVGNIFYEHGHRLVAATVGLLTLVLAVWTARREPRGWVRRLAWGCLAAVVAQGLLGGLTVKLLLPPPVSISHALLAQSFLCLVVWLAYATSREWLRPPAAPAVGGARERGALVACLWAAGAVFVQLVLGALMRHTESGLAVTFFPVDERGALLPEPVTGRVVIHMLHRGFAFVVLPAVLVAAARTARRVPRLRAHAGLVAALIVGQVVLGATVIWTAARDPADGVTPVVSPIPASLHVATGAALLALVWLLALRVWRLACATGAGAAVGAGGPYPRPVAEGAR